MDRPDGSGGVAGGDGPTELLAGTLVLEYSFADFSPDRLILDGFEYERLA